MIIPKNNDRFLGVDLGTTNTCVAIYTPEGSQVIDTEREGQKTFPSVVRIADRNLEENNTIVGSQAKKYILMKPQEVFSSVKSLMQDETWRTDKNLLEKFTFGDVVLTPTNIAEKILSQALEYAQNSKFGDEGAFNKVVICVPANSTAYYKDSIKKIAQNVGFGVKNDEGEYILRDNGDVEGIYILAEPTAAALCYAKEKGICDSDKVKEQTLLIYDFGGGTFDVTILRVKTNGLKASEFDILGTYGVGKLGGDDLDRALMCYVSEQFFDETGIDLMDPTKDNKGNSPKAIYQAQTWLKEEAEKAKIDFANGAEEYNFDYPAIIDDNDEDKSCNLDCIVTREQFKDIINPILNKTVECVNGALEASGLTTDLIDRFIIVGGSSKGPWVSEILEKNFGRSPYSADNLDTIVARGAAFFGSEIAPKEGDTTGGNTTGGGNNGEDNPNADEGSGVTIKSKTSHNIGIELSNGFFSPLIEKGMDTPCSASAHYTNAHERSQISIPVWATIRNLEVSTINGENRIVYEPVHGKDDNNNDLFQYWGEMRADVPEMPANTLDIEITLVNEADNSINVKVVVNGGEEQSKKITFQK